MLMIITIVVVVIVLVLAIWKKNIDQERFKAHIITA